MGASQRMFLILSMIKANNSKKKAVRDATDILKQKVEHLRSDHRKQRKNAGRIAGTGI